MLNECLNVCVGGCVYGWLCLLWWLSCSWTDATSGVCEEQVRLKQKGDVITLTVPQQGCGSLALITCLRHVTDRRGFSPHIPVPGTCAKQRTAGSTGYANLSLHKQGAGLEDKVTWSQLGLGKNMNFLISCDFQFIFLKISRLISQSMYIFSVAACIC